MFAAQRLLSPPGSSWLPWIMKLAEATQESFVLQGATLPSLPVGQGALDVQVGVLHNISEHLSQMVSRLTNSNQCCLVIDLASAEAGWITDHLQQSESPCKLPVSSMPAHGSSADYATPETPPSLEGHLPGKSRVGRGLWRLFDSVTFEPLLGTTPPGLSRSHRVLLQKVHGSEETPPDAREHLKRNSGQCAPAWMACFRGRGRHLKLMNFSKNIITAQLPPIEATQKKLLPRSY